MALAGDLLQVDLEQEAEIWLCDHRSHLGHLCIMYEFDFRLAHTLREEEESTCSEPASHHPVVGLQIQHNLFTTKEMADAGRAG